MQMRYTAMNDKTVACKDNQTLKHSCVKAGDSDLNLSFIKKKQYDNTIEINHSQDELDRIRLAARAEAVAKKLPQPKEQQNPEIKFCEIYGLAWNKCAQYSNQFVACDSDARLTVWEYNGNKVKPVQSEKTDKAGLRCVSIEPE